MEKARRAEAEVYFDGVDISGSIKPYLISLTFTDNEENETDDIQIKLHDSDGIWMESWLGAALDAAASSASGGAVTVQSSHGVLYRVTANSGLNVRSGPGTNYSKIGALVYGAQVTVNDTSGSWSMIDYNGKTAYVSSNYLAPIGGGKGGGAPITHSTLRFGASGDETKLMQQLLIEHGHSLPRYGADGYFGKETHAAVIAFQQEKGLSVDGVCGPITWAALEGQGKDSSSTLQSKLSIHAVIARVDWPGTKTLDCGQFQLDSVSADGPPATITIKATSLPYSTQIRQTKKSKAWEAYYLSGIAEEMASLNGMACMFLSNHNPYYARVEQFRASDISFLSDLCHKSGMSLKATNNILVIFDQATYEAKPSVFTLHRSDNEYTRWRFQIGESDTQYSACRVTYTNAKGQHFEGNATSEDYDDTAQALEIYAQCDSNSEASYLAAKYLRLHNKYAKTLTFTLPGNPDLVAGATVSVDGWGAFDGDYIITQSKHIIGSGYTTQIKIRPKMREAVSVYQAEAPKVYSVGDVVNFTGNMHYIASTSDKGYKTNGGSAKITQIATGAKHPYHLIHCGAGCTVYGWVDEGDFT